MRQQVLPPSECRYFTPELHDAREIGELCLLRGAIGQGLVTDWLIDRDHLYRDCRRPAEPIEVTEEMGW